MGGGGDRVGRRLRRCRCGAGWGNSHQPDAHGDRSAGAERASWWHLAGIAAAVFVWLGYPTTPGILAEVSNARDACYSLYWPTPGCLSRVTQAMDNHNLSWWLTGGLILAAALLTRRSRIAAWAAIPTALAGCLLATHFLELLLVYYHSGNP